uniref:Cutinase, putative n=1 Tax=Phytophthora infestans TaxID=4787 RepID=Q572I7_PHYIN|nr:cutinase, putative [Phytophthora infestans]
MRSTSIPSRQCSNLSFGNGFVIASARTKWNLFIMYLLLLCLPGLAVRYIHELLKPMISGVANSQHRSSQSPRSHCRSVVSSFMAIYSASAVLCVLIACFLDPYETTLPLTKLTSFSVTMSITKPWSCVPLR